MKRIAWLLVVVFGGLLAAPARAEEPSIAGVYLVTGLNPEGNPYRGVVEIKAVDGRLFNVHWVFPGSDGEQFGVGFVSAGVFAVNFHDNDGGVGLVIYKIDGDTLTGEWAMSGSADVFGETLSRMPADHAPSVERQKRKPPPDRKNELKG